MLYSSIGNKTLKHALLSRYTLLLFCVASNESSDSMPLTEECQKKECHQQSRVVVHISVVNVNDAQCLLECKLVFSYIICFYSMKLWESCAINAALIQPL